MLLLINNIQKDFFKIKSRNFGLGYKTITSVSQKFGLPASWRSNIPFSKKNLFSFKFSLLKSNNNLETLILSNSFKFNLGLKRFLSKHIRILKLNRSLRGIRHSQFLPVRGQRTKTNSRTQKSRRR